MDAIIINSSDKVTLSPLCRANDASLLTVMGKPVIDIIKDYLFGFGVKKIFVYKKDDDFSFFSGKESVIVVENNLITSEDINKVIAVHNENCADMTVVLRTVTDGEGNMRVNLNSSNIITGLSNSGYRSANTEFESEGIFIVNKSALALIAENGELNGTSILKSALNQKKRIYGYVSQRPSNTISSLNSYKKCHSEIMNNRLDFRLDGHMVKEGLWIEENVILESGVRIETPAYISRGCRIERGAKIGGETFLAENCTIKANADISHSIIGRNCTLSENAIISGAVLADNVNVGMNSVLNENVIVGSDCRIEENCTLRSGIRIWQNKRIKKGTRVNDNLVWGSVGTEHLFRDGKLYGEVNIDITPEFIAKLGSALGTMFNGERIGLGYDSAPVCMMLAGAAASGIISSGARLFSFDDASLPVMRSGTKYYGLKMSLYINQSDSDGIYYPEIEFIESDGSNLGTENTKILEGIFFNNVFYRADVANIREAMSVKEFRISYIQSILNIIKSRHFIMNMELQTKSETVSDILEVLLSEIERHADKNIKKQFITELDRNGKLCSIRGTESITLDKNQFLSAAIILLTEHFETKEAALPVSAPRMLENRLKNAGIKILKCGTSDEEFLNFLIKNGLDEQFRLCFDGIYFSVALLDYLNSRGIEFSEFCKKLPIFIHREIEIECPNSRKSEVIKNLYSKYKNSKTDMTEGIKIYSNNGWVLVLPEKYRHCIKIITEGYDAEAAEELSTIFTNQVKRLAKLN